VGYAATADIQARIPSRTIGASTEPSTTQVGLYITDAEAKINGALRAAGITTPVEDTDGVEIITAWVATYCEGRARMAWAAGAGDGDNDDGKDMVDWFNNVLIQDILDKPTKYELMLTGSGSSSVQLKSYILDNNDDKTIDGGDFDPIFDTDTAPEDQW